MLNEVSSRSIRLGASIAAAPTATATSVTAAVPAPKVLTWDRPPTPDEAEAAVRDLPRWHDDPQGDPGWRRHVAGIAALAVVAELTHPIYREAPC